MRFYSGKRMSDIPPDDWPYKVIRDGVKLIDLRACDLQVGDLAWVAKCDDDEIKELCPITRIEGCGQEPETE